MLDWTVRRLGMPAGVSFHVCAGLVCRCRAVHRGVKTRPGAMAGWGMSLGRESSWGMISRLAWYKGWRCMGVTCLCEEAS